jgi:hypothetical protein
VLSVWALLLVAMAVVAGVVVLRKWIKTEKDATSGTPSS